MFYKSPIQIALKLKDVRILKTKFICQSKFKHLGHLKKKVKLI